MRIKVFTKAKCFAMHMLTCPVLGFKTPGCYREPLLLYIVATMQVVSATLVVEREEEGHALKV